MPDTSEPAWTKRKTVIHQQQHVAMQLVAKIFGDGEGGHPDSPPRTRRVVHLAEDQRGSLEHVRLAQFGEEFMTLARALAHAGKHRDAGVFFDRVAYQLHDQNGLADACAADHPGFSSTRQRGEQIDNLDTGAKHLTDVILTAD
jgi:hypothetical protein